MNIIDTVEGIDVMRYKVECSCGKWFLHRTDRTRVECPHCHRIATIETLRRTLE